MIPIASSEDYRRAHKFSTAREGGYVNNPKDPGGETKYGITKRDYPHEDIKGLIPARAEELYRIDYWGSDPGTEMWQASMCDRMPWPVNMAHFDATINIGNKNRDRKTGEVIWTGNANKIIQRACGVPADGHVGPVTLRAIWSGFDASPRSLLDRMLAERRAYYRSLPERLQREFLRGWLKRMDILEHYLAKEA